MVSKKLTYTRPYRQALVVACLQCKSFENNVAKGEIVHDEQFLLFLQYFLPAWRTSCCYEQFLLFPQCFHKACFPGASKGVIVWEWVKYLHCRHIKKQGLVWERVKCFCIISFRTLKFEIHSSYVFQC